MPSILVLSIFTFLFGCFAEAGIQLPKNLDQEDRRAAVRLLGFTTAAKLLSDPYPLGGYAGFEVGIAVENLPVEDLGHLGDKLEAPQHDVMYPKLSIGKGLYNNIDLFLNFNPYSSTTNISQYGGILRWGFLQASFLPLSASVLLHLNNTNFNNLVTTRTMGLDLIGGINADNLALFAGVGPIRSTGRFIGGAEGVTDSGKLENETVDGFHTVFGANVRIANAFFSAEIDRYTITVYSAKLGMRF